MNLRTARRQEIKSILRHKRIMIYISLYIGLHRFCEETPLNANNKKTIYRKAASFNNCNNNKNASREQP